MKIVFFISVILLSLITFLSSCENDPISPTPQNSSPTVIDATTNATLETTYNTIKISGNVTADGGSTILERGICWSSTTNPTINDNKSIETSDIYTSTITGLDANTVYYFKAYATNSEGTSYSAEASYSTLSLDGTTWDFTLTHNSDISWNADITFNADGTTIYDEPSEPGVYLTNGTWSLNGNTLTYDMDSADTTNTSYQFTGTLMDGSMNGTYTFGTDSDKTWTSIPK